VARRDNDEAQRIPPCQGPHEIGIIPDGRACAALECGEILPDEVMEDAYIICGIMPDMQLSGDW
jgi:hypothetical protein